MVDGSHSLDLEDKDKRAIEQALNAILADSKFAASPQMSAFLDYVVKQTIDGEAARIKAYSVAVDALGKPSSFDAQSDPSVRVLANRLRACLKQYYERSADHAVTIELKSGSYIPQFVFADNSDEHAAAEPQPDCAEHTDALIDPQAAVAEVQGSAAAEAPASVACDTEIELQREASSAGAEQPYRTLAQWLRPLPVSITACVTLLMITWVLSPSPSAQDKDQAAVHTAAQYTTRPASYNMAPPARSRPELPTLMVRAGDSGGVLSRPLISPVSAVVSRLEHIELLDPAREFYFSQTWPEDYELSVDSLVLQDQIRISLKISHLASNRVVGIEALELTRSDDLMLSSADINAIEEFVTQLLHADGLMMSDYNTRSDAHSL